MRRKLRKIVHLTKAACLGPCALANVASLMFDGQAMWFHSVDSTSRVRLIFDHVETMIGADRFLPPPADLAVYAFNFYDWDSRQDSPSQDDACIQGVRCLHGTCWQRKLRASSVLPLPM